MDVQQQANIRNFLFEFKRIATEGRGIDFVPRRENLETLAELGLTVRNARDEITGLSVSDYCEGPIPDKDKPGNVWVFGKEIGGKEVYIKIRIASTEDKKIAKCISFHSSRRPLRFPYRNQKGRGQK